MYNEQGELIWEVELDIYGKVKEDKFNNRFSIPFRYQGQYKDEETGLYYNRFRYYSPDSGIYVSQDPIKLEGNNPNLYAYVSDSNVLVGSAGQFADHFGVKYDSKEAVDISKKQGWHPTCK